MPTRFNTIDTLPKGLTTIVVHPGVDDARFEQFMNEDVFPAINLATRLFETREHVLLKSDQKVEGGAITCGRSSPPRQTRRIATTIWLTG